MHSDLNKEQQRAASHLNGPMMVIAGPGSGKTTVLTSRVENLISRHHIPAAEILVITFTRAAALEMQQRFLKKHGGGHTAVCFGTFHSVFLEMLKRYSRDFQVRLMDDRIAQLLLKETFCELYPGKKLSSDMYTAMLGTVSGIKNGKLPESSLPEGVMERYTAKAEAAGLIDFDDMMLLCLKMLKKSPDILKSVRERYRYLLIDEFQDINRLQYEIVRLIAAPLNNLFIVGDDDQSIYGFRGSDPSIMLHFSRDFPNSETVLLGVNYRSCSGIVGASMRLIGYNRDRFDKKLQAFSAERGVIRIKGFPDSRAEAAEVMRILKEHAKIDSGAPTAAVLTRTHRSSSQFGRLLAAEAGGMAASSVEAGSMAARAAEGVGTADFAENVKLYTFHGSKGLEFDIVFIIEADEGITPQASAASERALLEEERRMFYVAATRAKKELYIFYTESEYDRKKFMSRFVSEFDGGVLKRLIYRVRLLLREHWQ